MNYDPNQVLDDAPMFMMPPSLPPPNPLMFNQPMPMPTKTEKPKSVPFAGVPSLHIPAIAIFALSWLLHTIATFIPYWANYSGVANSRAGLWSARNFDYFSIQNFYFPEPNTFPNLTNSIRFTEANTKGYMITVQFLMMFNFVFMLIVLALLIVDYVFSRKSPQNPHSLLIRTQNTCDTVLVYGLLLYILYIFTVFEFAAWVTYVGSRHDNFWRMNASFVLTVIISVFLIIVFVMYAIEFVKTFGKNRVSWDYWYGPYIEWSLFIYLTALIFLLLAICCPEWGYAKVDSYSIFAEIGLFKQCHLSVIYKKTPSPNRCTLSNPSSNQSWVNASQAFMLMSYIVGIIVLVVAVVFRTEFQHTPNGYRATRVTQPMFSFILSGLILFFCFIFSLIGISVFGSKVFRYNINSNWGFILAVFAMILFLITGILIILDALHSKKQLTAKNGSSAEKLLFPEPLNQRASMMQPLISPEPPSPPPPLPPIFPMQNIEPWQGMAPYNFPPYPQPPIYPYNNEPQQYPFAPISEMGLANYFHQVQDNPQLSPALYNQGLIDYANINNNNLISNPNQHVDDIYENRNLNDVVRLHFVQRQRLRYNHERLLERYSRLRAPHVSQYKTYGTSSLPGRNYDQYLQEMRGYGGNSTFTTNSVAAWSRARIGSSDETYRWMDENSMEPLPRDASSFMQHTRDYPMSIVRAERFEPVKIYNHPIFGPTPAYLRPIYKKTKDVKPKHNVRQQNTDAKQIPPGYIIHKNWKDQYDKLVPVNPVLFNAYTERRNGSIKTYGQSLYAPSISPKNDKHETYYEDTSNLSESDDETKPLDKYDTSSINQYNKLHSISNYKDESKFDTNSLYTSSPKTNMIGKENLIKTSNSTLNTSNKNTSLLSANKITVESDSSDDDDDKDEENRPTHRQVNKKSTTTTTRIQKNADIISSSSENDD